MVDSSNSQGGSQETDGAQRKPAGESQHKSASNVDAVAALLRGDESEPGADSGSEPGKKGGTDTGKASAGSAPGEGDKAGQGESPSKAKPKTLDELAERTGVKVEDLYGIEFKSANGEKTHTIGELKDHLAERGSFEAERLSFEEKRTKTEADFLKAQSELNELIGLLPKDSIKPELVEKVRARREQVARQERERTLDAIEEWKDEDKEKADREGMKEHLAQYGFPGHYLDSITDHRTLKYLRDNWLREQRVKRALERMQEVKPAAQKPSGQAAPTGKGKRARGSGRKSPQSEQVSKVAELLAGNDT